MLAEPYESLWTYGLMLFLFFVTGFSCSSKQLKTIGDSIFIKMDLDTFRTKRFKWAMREVANDKIFFLLFRCL